MQSCLLGSLTGSMTTQVHKVKVPLPIGRASQPQSLLSLRIKVYLCPPIACKEGDGRCRSLCCSMLQSKGCYPCCTVRCCHMVDTQVLMRFAVPAVGLAQHTEHLSDCATPEPEACTATGPRRAPFHDQVRFFGSDSLCHAIQYGCGSCES